MSLSDRAGALLPLAIRFVPEAEPRPVVVFDVVSRAVRSAVGMLVARNWLGAHPVSCVVSFAGGVELTCRPNQIEDAPVAAAGNVVRLSDWRRP